MKKDYNSPDLDIILVVSDVLTDSEYDSGWLPWV